MYNTPEGSDNDPYAPWNSPIATECPQCGTGMVMSTLDKDLLICENGDCVHEQDITPYTEETLWNIGGYDEV